MLGSLYNLFILFSGVLLSMGTDWSAYLKNPAVVGVLSGLASGALIALFSDRDDKSTLLKSLATGLVTGGGMYLAFKYLFGEENAKNTIATNKISKEEAPRLAEKVKENNTQQQIDKEFILEDPAVSMEVLGISPKILPKERVEEYRRIQKKEAAGGDLTEEENKVIGDPLLNYYNEATLSLAMARENAKDRIGKINEELLKGNIDKEHAKYEISQIKKELPSGIVSAYSNIKERQAETLLPILENRDSEEYKKLMDFYATGNTAYADEYGFLSPRESIPRQRYEWEKAKERGEKVSWKEWRNRPYAGSGAVANILRAFPTSVMLATQTPDLYNVRKVPGAINKALKARKVFTAGAAASGNVPAYVLASLPDVTEGGIEGGVNYPDEFRRMLMGVMGTHPGRRLLSPKDIEDRVKEFNRRQVSLPFTDPGKAFSSLGEEVDLPQIPAMSEDISKLVWTALTAPKVVGRAIGGGFNVARD